MATLSLNLAIYKIIVYTEKFYIATTRHDEKVFWIKKKSKYKTIKEFIILWEFEDILIDGFLFKLPQKMTMNASEIMKE